MVKNIAGFNKFEVTNVGSNGEEYWCQIGSSSCFPYVLVKKITLKAFQRVLLHLEHPQKDAAIQ
jgi:hypothetical protein